MVACGCVGQIWLPSELTVKCNESLLDLCFLFGEKYLTFFLETIKDSKVGSMPGDDILYRNLQKHHDVIPLPLDKKRMDLQCGLEKLQVQP